MKHLNNLRHLTSYRQILMNINNYQTIFFITLFTILYKVSHKSKTLLLSFWNQKTIFLFLFFFLKNSVLRYFWNCLNGSCIKKHCFLSDLLRKTSDVVSKVLSQLFFIFSTVLYIISYFLKKRRFSFLRNTHF